MSLESQSSSSGVSQTFGDSSFGTKRSKVQILSPRLVSTDGSSDSLVESSISGPPSGPLIEVWKEIAGHPEYEVSNLGRARSYMSRGRNPHIQEKPSILKGTLKKGYVMIGVAGRPRRLHRIILETFVGPCPQGMECAHADGNSQNNRLDNLKWKTQLENNRDRIAHGTVPRGSNNPHASLDETRVGEIKSLIAAGVGTTCLALHFGVTTSCIDSIKSGRNWRHVPAALARATAPVRLAAPSPSAEGTL